jgi:catechol 2,3-dioxygenase-like lactoylglutathione lyase family enzyme
VFDHIAIHASDRAASEAFYDTVLGGVLGLDKRASERFTLYGGQLVVSPVSADHAVTRRLHVGLGAPSREQVDAFWRAGVDAGYRSDGEPGPRPQYTPDYYGAFLLDPDGNSIEAVHYDGVNRDGPVDHVWMRVLDVPSAQAFYATIAPAAHLRPGEHDAQYAIFRLEGGGSLSLVAGDPTEGLHVAFRGTRSDVHAFHEAATAAGYRDNGAPGERPAYHPGYYAAFVLDPDGNNIEVVSHREA